MLSHYYRLWSCLSKELKVDAILVIVIALINSIFESLVIFSVVPLLGLVSNKPDGVASGFGVSLLQSIFPAEFISHPLKLFLSSVCVSLVVRVIYLRLSAQFLSDIGTYLTSLSFRTIVNNDYLYFKKINNATLQDVIVNKVNQVVSNTISPALTIVTTAILFTSLFLTTVSLDPIVVFSICGSIVSVFLMVMLFVRGRLAENSVVISDATTKILKQTNETLGGIRDVLINQLQLYFVKIHTGLDSKYRAAQASNLYISQLPRYVIEAFSLLIIAMILSVKLTNPESGGLALIGAIMLGFQKMLPLIQQIYAAWASIAGYGKSLRELSPFLVDKKFETYNSEKISFKHKFSCVNVSFKYADRDIPILNNISFEIDHGDFVGVIGKTGSGKSTLLDVLMGLLQPSSGAVKIDTTPITTANKNAFYNTIAHVPQSVYIPDISIKQNIAFGVPEDKIDILLVQECAE